MNDSAASSIVPKVWMLKYVRLEWLGNSDVTFIFKIPSVLERTVIQTHVKKTVSCNRIDFFEVTMLGIGNLTRT